MTQRRIVTLSLVLGLSFGVLLSACDDDENCEDTCNGCCDADGFCQAGGLNDACGTGGASCLVCPATQVCQAGACVTSGNNLPDAGTQPDGGNDGGIGAACTADTQCANGICFSESTSGIPGGYCTADCTMTACPAGSLCSPFFIDHGGDGGVGAVDAGCMVSCAAPGTQSTCRTGQVCDKFWIPSDLNAAVCAPACISSADCANLDPNSQCENGFCCGVETYRCCAGATPCLDGTTCGTDGYCQ